MDFENIIDTTMDHLFKALAKNDPYLETTHDFFTQVKKRCTLDSDMSQHCLTLFLEMNKKMVDKTKEEQIKFLEEVRIFTAIQKDYCTHMINFIKEKFNEVDKK